MTPRSLWGDGTPTREFLFVEDCARAIRLAWEKYDEAAPLNLGSGVEVSMTSLATIIASAVGFHGTIDWDSSRPGGQPRRIIDSSRASEMLDFRAQVSLEDGIARTVEWYRASADESKEP